VISLSPFSLADLKAEGCAAIGAVRDAMVVAGALEGRVTASAKIDRSPVTIADLAIQALVARRLREDFPDDSIVAEEDASLVRDSAETMSRQVVEAVRRVVPDATHERVVGWIDQGGERAGSRFWTLDPIDGTKGFVAGRQYAISLALIVDGAVQLGTVGCPRLRLGSRPPTPSEASGGIAMAVRGRGTWWNAAGEQAWQRLEVSTGSEASTARIVQSFEPRHGDADRNARVLWLLGSELPPRLMDSQAKHVTVAAGVNDLLMRFPPDASFHDAIWDQAAGALLVEEAGGRVTDLSGRPLDFTAGPRLLRNDGVLVSNGRLHRAALDAIQRAQ